MDWKEWVNWFVSPLPRIFSKNTKGEDTKDNSIAENLKRGWRYFKIFSWSVLIIAAIGAVYKMFQYYK